MIFDSIPFAEVSLKSGGIAHRALSSFIAQIEKKLGVIVSYDARTISLGRPDLLEATSLAHALERAGVIHSLQKSIVLPDEVPLTLWSAKCGDTTESFVAGCSPRSNPDSDLQAMYACLAEGVERSIWFTASDHCKKTVHATTGELQRKRISFIPPERFAGFNAAQRENNPKRELRPDSSYFWTRGLSLVRNTFVHLPFQTVSGKQRSENEIRESEPFIRQQTTIGLATWPTRKGAQLAGALEIIEREAYMIMWLNQLTLPKINLDSVCKDNEPLHTFIEKAERYNFKVHAIQMLTDAPTHAICVMVEDLSGMEPRFTMGLKSHRSLPYAIEKAMTEALRARRMYRHHVATGGHWDSKTPVLEVGHAERVYYWGVPENAKCLEFLIAGKEIVPEKKVWDSDTEDQHLSRILVWCRTSNFECISVPLTSSAKNVTPWHIEMMVMPDLQPTYLYENSRSFGCNRWQEVPKKFDITPRDTPYEDRPHPFA